jgi:TatD DNase family protein
MALIDTHCHLYLQEFSGDIKEVIKRATDNGVERFYLPNIDSLSLDQMLQLEKDFPMQCKAMAGLHPCSVKEAYIEELAIVKKVLGERPFVAVGEIGLDFYWDRTFEKQQYEAFHQQIEWALEYRVPIVIHSRESMQECIDTVKEHQEGALKGVFHCFTGSEAMASQVIDLGFYLGIGGVLTYKNSGLAETIRNIDLRYLVLETDAPFLTPVPFRGKRNESSYLRFIAEKLASIKNISVSEVEKLTTLNAEKIFGS